MKALGTVPGMEFRHELMYSNMAKLLLVLIVYLRISLDVLCGQAYCLQIREAFSFQS